MWLSHKLRSVVDPELPSLLTLVDSGFIYPVGTATVNLGTAFTNRHVILCASTYRGADSRYITAASIGGTSLTFHVNAQDSTGTVSTQALIASAIINTGTSATLSFTVSGTVTGYIYYIFVATNSSTTVTSTSTSILTSSSTNQTATFTNFNTGSYGIIYGEAGYGTGSDVTTFSYGNATESANVNLPTGGTNMYSAAATLTRNTKKDIKTVSLTMPNTYTAPLVAIASW